MSQHYHRVCCHNRKQAVHGTFAYCTMELQEDLVNNSDDDDDDSSSSGGSNNDKLG